MYEKNREKKKQITNITKILKQKYGKRPLTFLNGKKDYEFLFAVILSAQCTDARVNEVTKSLFKKYKTLKAFANATLLELEKDIKPCGFYKNKARNIKNCANKLISIYNSKVPKEMDDLMSLNGVGRKTANVIRNSIFNEPSIAVDTHVKRVSKKLGLTNNTNPDKVEEDLKNNLPKSAWNIWNTHIISIGREYCSARNQKCNICPLNNCCETYKIIKRNVEKKIKR